MPAPDMPGAAAGGKWRGAGVDFRRNCPKIRDMADPPRSLAEPARDWIARRVASGAWPDAEAYLNDLVARDRADAEKLATLKTEIAKGLASPTSPHSLDEIFAIAMARIA